VTSAVSPLLLQLLVDRLDVVVPFCEGEDARFHQQRPETDEHLSGHDLEPALGVVRCAGRVDSIA